MPGYKQRIATESSGMTSGGGYTPVDNGQLSGALRRELCTVIGTIEGELVPRLLRSVRHAPGANSRTEKSSRKQSTKSTTSIDDAMIEAFVDDLVRGIDLHRAIQALLARQVTVEQLYRELLATAARRLGERWEQDALSFADVTMAGGRLQQLLRELSHEFLATSRPLTPGRSILLAPCPGEQHLFGCLMAGEYYRHAGWEVVSLPACSHDELIEAVTSQWYSAVGLSASSARMVETLTRTIRSLRRVSMNRAIRVVVGGGLFLEHPEKIEAVGADAGASDGREAPYRTEQLVKTLLADSSG